MQNPFTLTFGRSPLESVDRPVQINEIIENFTPDTINQQMFIWPTKNRKNSNDVSVYIRTIG